METVTLKDGTISAKPLVVTTMMTLEAIEKENPVAIYDLVQKCKNANHKFVDNPFGPNSSIILEKYGLCSDDHEVQSSIRSIILNAVEKSGIMWRVCSPLK